MFPVPTRGAIACHHGPALNLMWPWYRDYTTRLFGFPLRGARQFAG